MKQVLLSILLMLMPMLASADAVEKESKTKHLGIPNAFSEIFCGIPYNFFKINLGIPTESVIFAPTLQYNLNKV